MRLRATLRLCAALAAVAVLLAAGAQAQKLQTMKNFALSSVSAGYDAAAVTITLTTGGGAKFPQPSTEGQFYLVWWNFTDYPSPTGPPTADPNLEIVLCTARSGDVLTVTRAQEGTSATTKNTGGKTYYMMQAWTAAVANAYRDTTRALMGARVYTPGGASAIPVGMNAARDSIVEWLAGGSINIVAGRSYTLVNDASAPGASMMYATNGAGVKGWYAQGSAMDGQDADSIKGKPVSEYGRPQAVTRVAALVFDQDSGRYVHKFTPRLNPTGTLGSTGKLYMDSDSTIKVGTDNAGGVSDGDKTDITVSGSGTVFTIDNGVVTLAKMADMATASLLGRNTAGVGAPEVLSASTARTLLSLVAGTNVQAWDADLDALAALASAGMVARTGAGTAAARTITGTANEVTVTNGDGASGNPTLSLPAGIDAAKIGNGAVSTTEFQYLSAVTSDVQTQLDAKVAKATMPTTLIIACSDETTDLTAGTAKVTFRMPYAMTLTAIRGGLSTVATGATLVTVDVNEGGATILSTKLTFDASEKTTTTAATPAVISDAALADDAEITIDIDAVGNTTAGKGLKVTLIGTRVAP